MYLMTGDFVTDTTYGSRSHLMNLRDCKWDPELLEYFGIEEKWLCRLLEPGSICGGLKEEFAAKCSLSAGIPVITAGGDQQCAAIGQGAYEKGTVSVVVGTGAYLVTLSDSVPENFSRDMICNCSSVRGKYVIEANTLTCAAAFDWFLREIYGESQPDYNKVNHEVEQIYEADSDVICLPYFQGRSTPDWNPEAKALFAGISLSTTKAEMMKSLLEGVFLEINSNIEELRKYTSITSINISGGMTKADILNRMQSDVYGLPLYILEDSETTSKGALCVALEAMGVYPSVKSAYEALGSQKNRKRIDFNEEKHTKYLKKQKQMNDLYKKIYKESRYEQDR